MLKHCFIRILAIVAALFVIGTSSCSQVNKVSELDDSDTEAVQHDSPSKRVPVPSTVDDMGGGKPN